MKNFKKKLKEFIIALNDFCESFLFVIIAAIIISLIYIFGVADECGWHVFWQ